MYYASVGLLALILHCIINLEYLKPGRSLDLSVAMERYRIFLYSLAIFYVFDLSWGVFSNIRFIPIAYIMTLSFFVSMVWTVLMWTKFVVAYLDRNNRFVSIITIGGWGIVIFEIVALIVNLFKPIVFHFDSQGHYHTTSFRFITLMLQLVLHLLSSSYTLRIATNSEGRVKAHHWTIGISGLVMAVFIALQAFFPHIPFYSVGCLIVTCIIHTYVVQDEKQDQKNAIGSAKQIALKDPLTGVKSKRAFQEDKILIDQRITTLELKELGVIVFDVNDLKKVNDTLGHEQGDQYIIEGSVLICKQFQHSPVYRIGGDEFVVILEGDDYIQRKELLENFDLRMEENNQTGKIVISTGMDVFRPGRDFDFNSIFTRADQRMYERKKLLKSTTLKSA